MSNTQYTHPFGSTLNMKLKITKIYLTIVHNQCTFSFCPATIASSATWHYKRNCLTELLKGITNYLQHLKHNLQNVAFHFLAALYVLHVGFSDRQKLIHEFVHCEKSFECMYNGQDILMKVINYSS